MTLNDMTYRDIARIAHAAVRELAAIQAGVETDHWRDASRTDKDFSTNYVAELVGRAPSSADVDATRIYRCLANEVFHDDSRKRFAAELEAQGSPGEVVADPESEVAPEKVEPAPKKKARKRKKKA